MFSAYIANGIGIWIGIQSFFNIGVNIGILPTKGLTLPFMLTAVRLSLSCWCALLCYCALIMKNRQKNARLFGGVKP